MAEMGIAPHVIERLLNHVTGTISGILAVYNRARYMAEVGTPSTAGMRTSPPLFNDHGAPWCTIGLLHSLRALG